MHHDRRGPTRRDSLFLDPKFVLVTILSTALSACGESSPAQRTAAVAEVSPPPTAVVADQGPTSAPQFSEDLTGELLIDGSSTAFPILEAAAIKFYEATSKVEIHLGVSGTGGGLRKFCAGEIQIAAASRSMKADEIDQCRQEEIDPVRIAIAYDGVSLVVPEENDWCECLDLDELRRVWSAAGAEPPRWNDLDAGWPNEPIALHGPGLASGTADFFVEAVLGGSALRTDVSASEDDYLIAQAVANDAYALGFFGYSYAQEHRGRLHLVAVDGGRGCVLPDLTTLSEGRYRPLSRQLAIYLDRRSLQDPAVLAFLRYFFENARYFAESVGAIPLPSATYEAASALLNEESPEETL